jgi:low temperature requirement protein LtrA
MFPVAGLAIFTHDAFGSTSIAFGWSYVAGRVITTLLWVRASMHSREFRPTGTIYIIGFTISIVLFTVSLWMPQSTRVAMWGVGLMIDLITPWFTLRHQAKLPRVSTSKYPERLGLFILIVLGESVVGVVNGAANTAKLDSSAFIPGILGITLGFSLWWVYFDYIARRVPKKNVVFVILWAYLHFPLAIGIAAIGASISNAISFAAGSIGVNPSPLLLGSAGVTMLALGGLEFTLHREGDEPTHPVISPLMKIIGGLLLLLIAPFATLLPVLNSFLAIIAVLVSQMVYGLWVWFTEGHGEGIRNAE